MFHNFKISSLALHYSSFSSSFFPSGLEKKSWRLWRGRGLPERVLERSRLWIPGSEQIDGSWIAQGCNCEVSSRRSRLMTRPGTGKADGRRKIIRACGWRLGSEIVAGTDDNSSSVATSIDKEAALRGGFGSESLDSYCNSLTFVFLFSFVCCCYQWIWIGRFSS